MAETTHTATAPAIDATFMWCLGCAEELLQITEAFCAKCGRCQGCGNKRSGTENVCSKCGHPLDHFRIQQIARRHGIAAERIASAVQRRNLRNRVRHVPILAISTTLAAALLLFLKHAAVAPLWIQAVVYAVATFGISFGLECMAERGWAPWLLKKDEQESESVESTSIERQ